MRMRDSRMNETQEMKHVYSLFGKQFFSFTLIDCFNIVCNELWKPFLTNLIKGIIQINSTVTVLYIFHLY